MRYAFFLFALIRNISVLASATIPVYAQETSTASLAVTPAIVDAPAAPGQSISRTIQITNNNTAAIPLSMSVDAAVIEGEPLDGFSDERYDVSDWIRFAEDTYVFEPGQTKKIDFRITVPLTASPGGHYAQIVLRSLSLQQDSDFNSIVLPEVGVPVLITVPGQLDEVMTIRENSLASLTVSRKELLRSVLTLENTGTVHNLATTRFELLKNDMIIDTFKGVPLIVLPGTSREVLIDWSIEDYGSYEVRAVVSYGSQQQVHITSAESVYVLPPIFQLFGLLIITWIAMYLIRHRTNLSSAVRTLLHGEAL